MCGCLARIRFPIPALAHDMQSQKKQKIKKYSVPAPVGGWNARDAYDDMAKDDAVILDDIFPNSSSVSQRNGSGYFANYVGHITAFTRATTGTYFDANAILQTAAINVPRYTSNSVNLSGAPIVVPTTAPGLTFISESAATNECLWNRDLTNVAWTKTNATVAKDQTGLDGSANAASSITATANNATCFQSITSASNTSRTFSIYLKRITGTGNLYLSLDNGSTYNTGIVPSTTGWYAYAKTQSLANPTIGIKLQTSGDKFAIDFIQEETGSTHTSPIATTTVTVTRAADVPTYAAGASINVVPSTVQTLFNYTSGTTNKFLAAANGCICDVSSGGGAGIPVKSGFTSDQWQGVNFNAKGILCNGVDTPQNYDGSTLADTTFTGSGLTITNLIYPNVFKGRAFFIEKNTLNAWYGGLNAVGGASGLSKLDFSGYCDLGGTLIAMATWTRDGGFGSDDFAVFLTSKGQVVIYAGTDPSSASTWALLGVFRIGSPIGQRPFIKAGADLLVISNDGIVPLSLVLPRDRIGAEKIAITDKIRNAFATATTTYSANFGWQGLLYPQGNWMLFNIPLTTTTSYQYVTNTITGAWCRFTTMNGLCWGLFNELIYFGAKNGWVGLADSGTKDYFPTSNGSSSSNSAVQGIIKPSFQRKGDSINVISLVRPVCSLTGLSGISNPGFNLVGQADYEDSSFDGSTPFIRPTNPTPNGIYNNWASANGEGNALTIKLWTKNLAAFTLYRIDYKIILGDGL